MGYPLTGVRSPAGRVTGGGSHGSICVGIGEEGYPPAGAIQSSRPVWADAATPVGSGSARFRRPRDSGRWVPGTFGALTGARLRVRLWCAFGWSLRAASCAWLSCGFTACLGGASTRSRDAGAEDPVGGPEVAAGTDSAPRMVIAGAESAPVMGARASASGGSSAPVALVSARRCGASAGRAGGAARRPDGGSASRVATAGRASAGTDDG